MQLRLTLDVCAVPAAVECQLFLGTLRLQASSASYVASMAYILAVLSALCFVVVQRSHVLGAATRSVELTSIGLVA